MSKLLSITLCKHLRFYKGNYGSLEVPKYPYEKKNRLLSKLQKFIFYRTEKTSILLLIRLTWQRCRVRGQPYYRMSYI